MNLRITPLIASCLMMITQECINGEVHAPISAELNGELYSSDYYTQGWAGYDMPSFDISDTVFYFSFGRYITSPNDKVRISVDLIGEPPVELHKKYKLGTNREDGRGIIWVDQGDRGIYGFTSTEGHVVFTKCATDTSGQVYRVSGNFEFTAVHSEIDSTIVVTNGTFERLPTY